mgnify:CR=1 FL=1
MEQKIILYSTELGNVNINVTYQNESFWLSQKAIAQLFGVEIPAISKHLANIYESGELAQQATISILETVQQEGTRNVKRNVEFYNLDAIIAVGYRVNSKQATQFRIWATQTLKDFIIKGFVLNDDMLKNGKPFGKDYFDELLERIREIRISERFFYQKIKDIYTTSIDYEPKDEKTIDFFKVVQNKLLWAINEQTAAELVYRRIDASLPLLGMQSLDKKNTLSVKKTDVGIAKNYLKEEEIKLLGLLVEQYLAFAETMAQQRTPMYMADWVNRLDSILQLNGRELLTHAGKISHEKALKKSGEEFEKYRIAQKAIEKEQSLKEIEEDIKKIVKG